MEKPERQRPKPQHPTTWTRESLAKLQADALKASDHDAFAESIPFDHPQIESATHEAENGRIVVKLYAGGGSFVVPTKAPKAEEKLTA